MTDFDPADWIDSARSLTYSSSVPLGVPINTHMDMLLRDTRRDLRVACDALEAVLKLHEPVDVWEIDHANGTWVYDDDERVLLARLCRECTPEFVLEEVDNSEYTPVFHGVEVAYPCSTVAALTEVLS